VIPAPRGALSEILLARIREPDADLSTVTRIEPDGPEDAHLALWVLYELHYRGVAGVSDELEWDPDLLRLRRGLEQTFEAELRARYTAAGPSRMEPFADALFDYIEAHEGPALSTYLQQNASRQQMTELLRHRSIYHLKEFDPSAWVIPRLHVVPQAALMELAWDEYGTGDPNRLHRHLFARGLTACGLDPEYGAYVDDAPLEILEQNNAMSLFGLHRRLRGAALGHLACFEATSSLPSRRLAVGLERLGMPPEITDYYTEHVEADAVHDQLAVRGICGSLVEAEPDLLHDVYFGAFTCLDLESRYAAHLFDHWDVPEAERT
jgi:hypothetical protein